MPRQVRRKRCKLCNRLYLIGGMLKVGNELICPECFKRNTIETDKKEGDHRERITKTNHKYKCKKCGRVMTQGMYEKTDGYCVDCMAEIQGRGNSGYHKCLKCGKYHDIHSSCCEIIPMPRQTMRCFVIGNERMQWNAKGYRYPRCDSILKPFDQYPRQELRLLPDKISEYLYDFYDEYEEEWYPYQDGFQLYNHWKDLTFESEVSFVNIPKLNELISASQQVKRVLSHCILSGDNVNKYSNMTITGVKDGKLEWTKLNLMGKKVVSYEYPNKFGKELGWTESNVQLSGAYKYKLSTDIRHKYEGLQANSRFGSCQQPNNCNSYSKGAYDFITNGCNAPILIYKEGKEKPIGRILCRLMYDKNNTEYLVVERIYHDGEFGCQHGSDESKGYVHRAIVEDLIRHGFNVVVSPFSAHDESVYGYMLTMGMNKGTLVKDLYEPTRLLYNDHGYYCDGGTKVYSQAYVLDEKDLEGCSPFKPGELATYATDYLSKGYLLSN